MADGQRKINEYFNEKGIYLLRNPREKLSPGLVYKSEADGIHLQAFGKLSTILEHKTDSSKLYTLPPAESDSPGDRLIGTIKNETNVTISLDFFKNLVNRFVSGLGAKISSKISNTSVLSAVYDISGISTESIEVSELIDSVRNYIIKEDFRVNNSRSNYYIVNRVWYSKSLQIILGNLRQVDIDFLADVVGQASGGVTIKNVSDTSNALVCDKNVAFGINVSSLDFNRLTEKTYVDIVPHDRHLVPFAAIETIEFRHIDG